MEFNHAKKRLGGGAVVALLSALFLALTTVSGLTAHATPKADGHIITVTSQEGDHKFGAYQIFAGNVEANKDKLTSITWGTQVNKDELLTELAANSTFSAKGIKASSSAAEVANAISGLKASEATEFSKIVTKHVTGNPDNFTKKNDSAPFTYESVKVAPGYYLVKDTDSSASALTSPILKVVNDVQVNSKSSVPTNDKEVKENSTSANGETADYEIGQDVPFTLTGTMPSNIADFTTYRYTFEDTLSKGLTFNNDVKVKIDDKDVPAANYTVVAPTVAKDTSGEYKDGKTFQVKFTDLKAAAKAAGADLTSSSKVVVTYTAKVNENAVINDKGNGNRSKVIYQKDVNGGNGDGETPEDHTWVFTYKLDTTKVDSATKTKIGGAKFRLYNKDKTKSAKIENNKITGWVDGDTGTEFEVAADQSWLIQGLDAGKYYLHETKAPTGYNLPEGDAAYFGFTISATHSEDAQGKGKLTELKITPDNGNPANGSTTDAKVDLSIENTSGSDLPSTGGVGTVIFTVVGLGVMAAAGVGIVYRRRKA